MRLTSIDIQGFKTFAAKTTVTFPAPRDGRFSFTAIVGPNGSGKSNIADAIRWCLGEQSNKLLRAKAAQDVIFSGSAGRARVGLAEVSLYFDNEDGALPVDFAEVVITRRLYRDGESEYLLNNTPTRVSDLHVMLAHAGVGVRSYTVIGQGMIDEVLLSSPQDRKAFFDDATGVRGLFLERHQASLKLNRAAANMAEVEMLLSELTPRLNMLARQVKKLAERAEAEAAYLAAARVFFAGLYAQYAGECAGYRAQMVTHSLAAEKARAEVRRIDGELEARTEAGQKDPLHLPLRKGEGAETQEHAARQEYTKAQEALYAARKSVADLERDLEIAQVRAATAWAPLSLTQIIEELEKMVAAVDLAGIVSACRDLLGRLRGPQSGVFAGEAQMRVQITQAQAQMSQCMMEAQRAEKKFAEMRDALLEQQKQVTAPAFDPMPLVREARKWQGELSAAEARVNEARVALARAEAHGEDVVREAQQLGVSADAVMAGIPDGVMFVADQARSILDRARRRYEDIGAIDEAVVAEHAQVQERHGFLTNQTNDLREAMTSTRTIIGKLDRDIRERGDVAFAALQQAFVKYFRLLFGGGNCALLRVKAETETDSDVETITTSLGDAELRGANPLITEDLEYDGVEIEAAPPLKKQKSLALLSGGERALISIALLCAIIETHPSPFVVLDEVDAALDEVNTARFAEIIRQLCVHTQFIAITHSRPTMERADALYGVALNDDATSRVLSVSMTDYLKQ